MSDGSINWNCPCLGGMASGPCGPDFREAFSCFHYSTEEPKGADCFEQFRAMQECMAQYPSLYDNDKEAEEEAAEEIFPTEDGSDAEGNDPTKVARKESDGRESDIKGSDVRESSDDSLKNKIISSNSAADKS